MFVGHLPVMNLKHQYTNKGNRLIISFKRLEVVSRKKPCTIPFQPPTLSGICKLCSFKQKKKRMRSPPSQFVRVIDHTLALTKYIFGGA